ncbi:MAG: hypothetical protein J6T64_01870 [Bacteroidaceae bacterium]|nr:hypothetical protein [Bacteroidaceae bacterium]
MADELEVWTKMSLPCEKYHSSACEFFWRNMSRIWRSIRSSVVCCMKGSSSGSNPSSFTIMTAVSWAIAVSFSSSSQVCSLS